MTWRSFPNTRRPTPGALHCNRARRRGICAWKGSLVAILCLFLCSHWEQAAEITCTLRPGRDSRDPSVFPKLVKRKNVHIQIPRPSPGSCDERLGRTWVSLSLKLWLGFSDCQESGRPATDGANPAPPPHSSQCWRWPWGTSIALGETVPLACMPELLVCLCRHGLLCHCNYRVSTATLLLANAGSRAPLPQLFPIRERVGPQRGRRRLQQSVPKPFSPEGEVPAQARESAGRELLPSSPPVTGGWVLTQSSGLTFPDRDYAILTCITRHQA